MGALDAGVRQMDFGTTPKMPGGSK